MVDRTTTIGDKYGKKGLANQKVPQSSKYTHVTSSVQHGRNASQVEQFSGQQIAKRRNENFYRIAAT